MPGEISESVAAVPYLGPLVQTLVGAGAAIFGGVIATAVGNYLHRRHQDRQLLRQKLEDMIAIAHETQAWAVERSQEAMASENFRLDVFPFHKMRVISALYWPELEEEVTSFSQAVLDFEEVVAQIRLERAQHGRVPDDAAEQLNNARRPVAKQREALADRAQGLAQTIANKHLP